MRGASRAKVSRSTSRVLQVAGVDADQLGAGVERPVDLFLVVHLDQRGQADRLGPLEQPTSAFWSSAATISSTRSAPAARASQSW